MQTIGPTEVPMEITFLLLCGRSASLGAWCCFRVLLVAFLQRQGYPGVEVDLDVDVDVWRLLTLAFAFAC